MTEPASIQPTPELPDWLIRANAKTIKLEYGMIQMAIQIGQELEAGRDLYTDAEPFKVMIRSGFVGTERLAYHCMAMARNPTCIGFAQLRKLPPDIETSGTLAQIEEHRLKELFDRGKASPTMSREQARILVKKEKLADNARKEAARRKRKGLPPKPSPLTGDAAKLHKAQLAQERSDRRAAIAEIPQEEIDLLGPIAAHEKDLAEYARYTPDFKAKILASAQSGANRLTGAIKLAETLGGGRQLTGRDGERVDWRITPAMVRLPDILEPVLSLLGQTVTAMRRAQKQIAEIPACDKVTLGRVPELLARVEQVEDLRRSLSWQVPAVVCERCEGKAQQPPCPDCRGCGWWDRATAAKRKADREQTDELRGRA